MEHEEVNLWYFCLALSRKLTKSPGRNSLFVSTELHKSNVILRRQHSRSQPFGGIKLTTSPSRFHNLSNDFEFAGWGSVSHLQLREDQIMDGEVSVQSEKHVPPLGAWMASAVAANEVFGSVFYAFPAVVLVAGVL